MKLNRSSFFMFFFLTAGALILLTEAGFAADKAPPPPSSTGKTQTPAVLGPAPANVKDAKDVGKVDAVPAAALSDQDLADVKKAEEYLNGLKSGQARFVQTTHDGTQLVGTFYLQRPEN